MLQFQTWKITLILAAAFASFIFAAPNLLTREEAEALPGFLPRQQINLGLDLQGGSHLLLEVDVDSIVRERLEGLVDEIRTVLRQERIGYTGLGVAGERVRFTLREAADLSRAVSLVQGLAVPITSGIFGGTGGQDIAVSSEDGGTVTVRLTEQAIAERKKAAVQQSIEIVRRRVDELGTNEPTIQRQGEDRILVQLPGVDDPDRIKRLLGKTAKLTFRLLDPSVSPIEAERGRVPPGSEILPADEASARRGDLPAQYVVRKRIMVGGERLIDAQPTYDQGRPVVNFRFDAAGAKRFGEATQENVGRPMAIVLDDKVVSAPVIRSPILGGSGIISGGFTVAEANDLAVLLRAGALPAPLEVLEERTVGPDLGADSIRAGRIAALIGLGAVVVFMTFAYGPFGLAADIALTVNMCLIAAVLSVLQATLTLPGIAGIVLTIGMAVDANVLIFERIREELRSGKTPFAAVDAGYARALGTILDANITTLIAALILFSLGSGPVKGFAVTLAIGVVTSVFTAFTLTRLMVATWLRRRRPATLTI